MSLAIECGATSSSAIYMNFDNNNNNNGKEASALKIKLGPVNFKILSQLELEGFFRGIKTTLGKSPVYEFGVGMPGILCDADKLIVENIIKRIWPELCSHWIGSDVETAMACLDSENGLKIIVIGGTGSNCYGSDGQRMAKIGGFGHILGDRGSSYAIALKTLQLSLREHEHASPLDKDFNSPQNGTLSSIIKYLKLNTVTELATWSTKASKTEIAEIAKHVIELYRSGDELAKIAITSSIQELVQDCVRLINTFIEKRQQSVQIGLTGSLFTKNEDISQFFQENVKKLLKNIDDAHFKTLHETVQGALKMLDNNNNNNNFSVLPISTNVKESSEANNALTEAELASQILPTYLGLPQTECRNPKSMNLDKMSTGEAVELMISEESGIYLEIIKQKPGLEILIERVSSALKEGGRLFYVGAGTSGRLGILDASECPPTFRTSPDMVQGIIAGGFSSVSKAKEGAEDSIIDGMNAINERFICEKDVVIGIAASGRTPFVWGAMYQAKLLKAFTTFLTFNVKLDMKIKPDLVLGMDLGPEVLTGSTRLKSGSATKCVLNLLSTLAMVRMGKCFENLMVDLNPANQKLKNRALRIVLLMTNNLNKVNEETALPILQKNKYDIKSTVMEIRQTFL